MVNSRWALPSRCKMMTMTTFQDVSIIACKNTVADNDFPTLTEEAGLSRCWPWTALSRKFPNQIWNIPIPSSSYIWTGSIFYRQLRTPRLLLLCQLYVDVGVSHLVLPEELCACTGKELHGVRLGAYEGEGEEEPAAHKSINQFNFLSKYT